jgi:peptidoglycan/LPS O-acetylase OafA/YrhL/ABC-type Fe3+-hydroxamate transport system substrate-binding protein
VVASIEQVRPVAQPVVPARTGGLQTFRPDVEGLRAVAIGLVVLYHVGIAGVSGGYVGVDVFFVISGFLITSLLVREYERDGRLSFLDFYARRARRILPLASLVLLATLGAAAVELSPARLNSIAHDGIWTSFFGANFHFAAVGADYLNATAPPSPLQHFWSLAVEEQFYVVWPALLLIGMKLFARRRTASAWRVAPYTGLLIAASLWWSIHQTATNANAAYFSPFTRAWELGLGALVAVTAGLLVRVPRLVAATVGWIGIAAIVFSAVHFDTTTAFPGKAALVPVVGAACVIAGGMRALRWGPEAALRLKPMQLLGRYSYALYLWHWPLLVIADGMYPGLGVGPKLGLVAIALLLSAAGYRWFENPIRRAAPLLRSRGLSLLVGAVCILATLAYSQMVVVGHRAVVARAKTLFEVQQKAANGRTVIHLATQADVTAAVASGAALRQLPSDISPPLGAAGTDAPSAYHDGCLVGTVQTTSPSCVSGDAHATRTVVLLGDSHAVQWLPALDAVASRRGLRIVTLAKHSCPVAGVHTFDSVVNRAYSECVVWRKWAFEKIAALHPDTVIATESLEGLVDARGHRIPGSDRVWQKALRKSLAALAGSAQHVYFLSDTPGHAQSVPDCLQHAAPDSCATPADEATNSAHQALDQASARAEGVRYVDTTPWFCTAQVCPAVIDHQVTDFDSNHMTSTYSTYLSHVFGVATGLESAAQASITLGGATGDEVKGQVALAASGKMPTTTITPPAALASTDSSPAYRDGCLVEARLTKSPKCTFGDLKSSDRVVLFGDSHAAQWMPALLDSATRAEFSLTVLTKGNCPAPIMSVYSVELHRAFTECDQWRQWALERIAQLKPSLVVISSTFHGQTLASGGAQQSPAVESAWEHGLSKAIIDIRATGARVAMLSDVPAHAQAVPDCVEAHQNSALSCATPTLNALLVQHQLIEEKVVPASGGQYVNVEPWFCTRAACPAVINGIITEFDTSHLTTTYSRYLAHALGVVLRLEP